MLSCRPRLKLRACNTRRTSWRQPTRSLHRAPEFSFLDEGLGKFLPPPALRTLAVDWHGGLLERLNEQVINTPHEGKNVAQTVLDTALRRSENLTFNYASLALNNHFFLHHLIPPSSEPGVLTHEEDISIDLMSALRRDFGGISSLKSMFGGYALGLNTSGYIWVVSDFNGHLAVLPTFGPGTLLIRNRSNMFNPAVSWGSEAFLAERQVNMALPPVDNAAPSHATEQETPPGVGPQSPMSGASANPNLKNPRNTRSMTTMGPQVIGGAGSRQKITTHAEMLNIGDSLFPLFCVSLYEHSWMSAGYGVWGKEEWLKELWTVLDWRTISNNYALAYRKSHPRIQ